ncbi:cysteine-rich secretory family protein, partial [Gregarina niphandrodes]
MKTLRAISYATALTSGLVRGFSPSEELLDLEAPTPDTMSNRSGSLRKVSLPSAWGDDPYPITHVQGSPMDEANFLGGGSFYTDTTDNGWRIRKSLLDMHNYVRKLEAPAALYMTKLVWDFHLEAFSRQWAQYLCENQDSTFFDHSP